MGAEALTGAIGALGSVAGNVVNGLFSKSAATTAFKRQKELMALQQQYAVENWNREVAYNDPKAQMQRLKDAGLNPNLVYGSGAAGLEAPSTAAPTAPSAPMQSTAPADFGAAVSDAVNAAVGIANAKKADSETIAQNIENDWLFKTLKDRIESVAIENNWKKEQTAKVIEETTNMVALRNQMQAEIDLLKSKNRLTQKEVSWYDRHMSAEIAHLKSSADYQNALKEMTETEKSLLEQSMDSLVSINKFNAELLQQSVSLLKKYGDAQAIIGMLGQLVSSASDIIGMFVKKGGLQIINNIPKPKG